MRGLTTLKNRTTYDTVRELGLAMKNVEESTSYGTPSLKVKKKFLLRLKEDGESIAIKIGFDEREMLMTANPDAFYVTDHYKPYPAMLVRLSNVTHDQLSDVLNIAYRFVASKRRSR
jgi:hypothetical protein